MKIRRHLALITSLLLGSSLALAACADDPAPSSDAGGSASSSIGDTLVVDTSFDLKTADPGRQYEPTGAIINKAVYQTLVTLNDDDLKNPVPELADFELSDDQKVLTLTLKDGNTFSNGDPVTVDDAVFSLERVQGLKGNPSFLLDGITIEKVDDSTLTLTSDEPMPDIPFKLANPSLSVINSSLVQENGGSTDESDGAEQFLNQTSAGSGPYQMDSYDVASEVVLVPNPEWSGEEPQFQRIVIRNVQGATQQLNVQGGQSHIALDLSPQQASQIDGTTAKVDTQPSETVVFLLLNQNPEVNTWTSNPDFVQAVRQSIDYEKIVELSGEGAKQAAGFIPNIIVGGLETDPTNSFDLEAAQAALQKSGYNGDEIPLAYANDLTVKGIELQTFAAAIQEQLKHAGINVVLAPSPVATELDAYRGGTEEIGLWYWNPDYFHPASYLVFSPGEMVGLRAGWAEGADDTVAAAHDAAATAKGDAIEGAYEEFQKAQNLTGPFVPLVQPPKSVAYAKELTELGLNPVWTIDVSKVH